MAAIPEKKLGQHAGPASEPSRTLPIPAAPDAKARTSKAKPKLKPKKSKLQFVVPAILLWKLRHAAADEGLSIGQLLIRMMTESLRDRDYPTMPEWIKRTGESEGDSSLAA